MSEKTKQRLRIKKEREFSPHHILLSAAYTALEDAEAERSGYFNFQLICITFSALALEALGNAFGEKFIPRWKDDFESASPIAKLRLICQRLKIEPDFSKDPWNTAIWLIKFRNKVAHAKPEFVKEDRIVSREEYDKLRFEHPTSKLEIEVSLKNAKRAFECVHAIHTAFCERIPIEQIGGLIADGWKFQGSVYSDED